MADVLNPMPGMEVEITVHGDALPAGGNAGDVLTKTENGAEWKGISAAAGGYYTPNVSENGDLSWTPSKSDMPAVEPVNIKGRQGDTGATGPAGATGADGVSATHSWNGTTLTVTSASGTSSADLKGDTGPAGSDGQDGYTPVKGVDYFTDADKNELVQAVLSALPAAEGVSY